MGCGCNETPCTGLPECTCPVKDLSTDCSVYTGPDLKCSGIKSNTILSDVLIKLDEFICNRIDQASAFLSLVNVGQGAGIFKGTAPGGQKEFRTILPEDPAFLDVVQNTDTVNLNPGRYSISVDGSSIVLNVETNAGVTEISRIDITTLESQDIHVVSGTYASEVLTLTMSDNSTVSVGIPQIVEKFAESGVYSNGTITVTLNDNTSFNIDVSDILTEALDNQINADYLESSPTSKAFIENKNPSKTITLAPASTYDVLNTDNNYIIEINNGAGNVTINFANVTATNNFFVGFVQRGTGDVAFTNYTISPADYQDILYGQGHVAALEIIAGNKYLLGSLKPV